MKGKIFLMTIFSILLVISLSQVFSIPPYQKDIFSVYKSGYFSELEKSSLIIQQAFFTLMTTKNKSIQWIYLKEVEKKTSISLKLYDRSGRNIISPGDKNTKTDEKIKGFMRGNASQIGEIIDGRYSFITQIKAEKQCLVCHRNKKKNAVMGAFVSNHPINGFIYYTSERIILFVILSILTASALFLIIRWDPDKNIKELFDK